MTLSPIAQTLETNSAFTDNPDCTAHLTMMVGFFERVGFNPPWIGYITLRDGEPVGVAAFKGKPTNGKVEIAYGTIDRFQRQGVSTTSCRLLVELAQQTDPSVTITARTLPGKNASTRILEKNGFALLGTVQDEEDGEVWEWEYQKS